MSPSCEASDGDGNRDASLLPVAALALRLPPLLRLPAPLPLVPLVPAVAEAEPLRAPLAPPLRRLLVGRHASIRRAAA